MDKNTPNSNPDLQSDEQANRNREDSGSRDKSQNYSPKKRQRIVRVEKNPRDFARPAGEEPQERKSFNPNFTQDNKLRDDSQSRYSPRDRGDSYRGRENDGERGGNRAGRYSNDRAERYSQGDREQTGGKFQRNDRGDRNDRYNREGSNQNRGNSHNRNGDTRYGNNRGDRNDYNRDGSSRGRDNRDSGYNKSDNYNRQRNDGDDQQRYFGGGQSSQNRGFGRQGSDRGGFRKTGYGDRKEYNRDGRDSRDNRQRGGGYGNSGYGSGRDNRSSQGRGFQKQQAYDKDNYPKFPRHQIEGEMRLNRYLAMSGLCSRREADDLIASGNVTVNGITVTELGTKILAADIVKYNEKVVRGENKVYIVMNKPKGFVTTLDDPHADKTVMDLLKNACTERVYPVGRLDKNSLGVLLITNDGDLTKKLTHPAHNKKKIYHVTLDKALTKADMEKMATGIELEDGLIAVDSVNYVGESRKEVGIEIHSGRNRIVRRIFENLGYQVLKLDRVYFAGLTKKNLKRGTWRFLNAREVNALMSGQYE